MTEERIVAFIDILGFKDLVSRIENGDDTAAASILQTLRLIKKFGKAVSAPSSTIPGVRISWLSDSVVISAAGTELTKVALAAGLLAARLCVDGVLVRGGIARGSCHHAADICFGPALVEAYEIESQRAYYPRIVLQEQLAADHRRMVREADLLTRVKTGWTRDVSLRRHDDGCEALDYLSNRYSERIGFDGRNGNGYVAFMDRVREAITPQLLNAPTPAVAMKLRWFATYFNQEALAVQDGGPTIRMIEAPGLPYVGSADGV